MSGNKPFGPEQARLWLQTLEKAHEESILMVQCALWAVKMLDSTKSMALRENPVYAIHTGKQIAGEAPVAPWPDSQMRNFEKLGRELDRLFHQINTILPEPKDGS